LKILVTGGAGFIGSHVVDAYLALGAEVVVVDDLSTGQRANLNPAAKFYQVDIRSPDLAAVFEKERPECVNHHAAQKDVRASMADPLFDAGVNVLGSINLLECCRQHGAPKFIYSSTSGAVFGEPEYLPCDEAHPIRPLSPYGASKHTVEHYLNMYRANYGLDFVVLRYSNVYGPRQVSDGEAGVVAVFARRMLAGQEVVINGDGEQVRDFIYVGDCARANVMALGAQAADPVYNLG
jgi:UDP-glucose 4-epimerase